MRNEMAEIVRNLISRIRDFCGASNNSFEGIWSPICERRHKTLYVLLDYPVLHFKGFSRNEMF